MQIKPLLALLHRYRTMHDVHVARMCCLISTILVKHEVSVQNSCPTLRLYFSNLTTGCQFVKLVVTSVQHPTTMPTHQVKQKCLFSSYTKTEWKIKTKTKALLWPGNGSIPWEMTARFCKCVSNWFWYNTLFVVMQQVSSSFSALAEGNTHTKKLQSSLQSRGVPASFCN